MGVVRGFKCDGCNNVVENPASYPPEGWMTVKIHLKSPGDSEMHVCTNLCLERLGRLRKNAERELLLSHV